MEDNNPTSTEPIATPTTNDAENLTQDTQQNTAGIESDYSGTMAKYGNDAQQIAKALSNSNAEAQRMIADKKLIEENNYTLNKRLVESDNNYLSELYTQNKELANKISMDLNGISAKDVLEDTNTNLEEQKQKWIDEGSRKTELEYKFKQETKVVNDFRKEKEVKPDSELDKKLAEEYSFLKADRILSTSDAKRLMEIAYQQVSENTDKENAKQQEQINAANFVNTPPREIKDNKFTLLSASEYQKLLEDPRNKSNMDFIREYDKKTISQYGTIKLAD